MVKRKNLQDRRLACVSVSSGQTWVLKVNDMMTLKGQNIQCRDKCGM